MGNPRTSNGARRREVRRWVLANYDHCAICGGRVDRSLKWPHPLSPSVDEILPVSKGGSPYDKDNVQLAHLVCNERRQARPMQQARRGRPTPPTTDADELADALQKDRSSRLAKGIDGKPLPRSRDW